MTASRIIGSSSPGFHIFVTPSGWQNKILIAFRWTSHVVTLSKESRISAEKGVIAPPWGSTSLFKKHANKIVVMFKRPSYKLVLGSNQGKTTTYHFYWYLFWYRFLIDFELEIWENGQHLGGNVEDFSTPWDEAAIRSLVDLDSIHTLSRKNKSEMKTKIPSVGQDWII